MKEIEIFNYPKTALVDEGDFEFLNKWRWHFHKNRKGDGYAARNVWDKDKKQNRIRFMHSFIHKPDIGMVTDHINGNKLDNRRSNLRSATLSQNQYNRKKNKGATKCKNKWQARIQVDGKRVSLGYFPTLFEAKNAYNRAALKHHGDYARFA